jgi:hypothetical protein
MLLILDFGCDQKIILSKLIFHSAFKCSVWLYNHSLILFLYGTLGLLEALSFVSIQG